MNPSIHFNIAAASHVGRVRRIDQDAVLAYLRPGDDPPVALLIVADGMGGHQAGEVASRLATETIFDVLRPFLEEGAVQTTNPLPVLEKHTKVTQSLSPLEERLWTAVQIANHTIYQYAQQHPKDAGNLGSTVTCALLRANTVVTANVGDSRIYHFSQGSLQQISEDHSYVGMLIREGQLPPEAVYEHPQRNVITRALGHQAQVEVDVWTRPLVPGDRILLCSDGLWEMVRDGEIAAHLKHSATAAEAVEALIETANTHGGVDNIGVAVALAAP